MFGLYVLVTKNIPAETHRWGLAKKTLCGANEIDLFTIDFGRAERCFVIAVSKKKLALRRSTQIGTPVLYYCIKTP